MTGNAGAVRAGKAFVEVSTKDDTASGLKAIEARLKGWGKSLKAVGATFTSMGTKLFAGGGVLSAGLLGAVKLFSDMGSDLKDMSDRTGASVEGLSELGFAAEQSGATMEDLESGLKFMQKALVAGDPAFAALGLNLKDLKALAPEEQLTLLADAISRIPDEAVRNVTAMGLMGKGAGKLMPLMLGGRDAIESLRAEARRLGITMSTKDAEAAEAFGDQLSLLWKVVKMGTFHIGAALVPQLEGLVTRVIDIAAAVSQWLRDNRELTVTLGYVAAGAVATGAALIALGGALTFTATLASAAAAGITAVVAVAKFAVTPLGLLSIGLAAVAGTLGYMFVKSGNAGRALQWLGEQFTDLRSTAGTAWTAVMDSFGTGDLSATVEVAWAGVKAVWSEGVVSLMTIWNRFMEYFDNAWFTLKTGWVNLIRFLEGRWIELVFNTRDQFAPVIAAATGETSDQVRARNLDEFAAAEVASRFKKRDQLKALDEEKQKRTAGRDQGLADAIAARDQALRELEQSKTGNPWKHSGDLIDTQGFQDREKQFNPQDWSDAMSKQLGQASGGISSTSTFNPFQALNMGFVDPHLAENERIRKELEKVNDKLGRIQNGGGEMD